MADEFIFEDSTGTVGRLSGQLHDPAATTGHVLSVAAGGAVVSTAASAGFTPQSITGALSTVADAPAKAVLTSIIAGLVALGLATDNTT